MLQLQIADDNVSSGSIAVSWCLDHEVLNELAERGLHDPQVVIVVVPKKNYHISKESRRVVPLKDLMTYIECRTPGPCKIYGLISFRTPRDCREHFLSKENGAYQNNVLDYDGESYSHKLLGHEDRDNARRGTYKYLSKPLAIRVPKGVFAKDPPKWEKSWVNLYFRSKVIDQCDYRRRRMFAYLVQPWIVLVNIFIRTLILIAGLLTGAKSFSLSFLNPITYRLRDCWDIWEKGSIFIKSQPEDKDTSSDMIHLPLGYFVRSFWLTPLMPLISIPVGLLYWSHHYVLATTILAVLFILVPCSISGISYLATNGNGGRLARNTWRSMKKLFEPDELWYMQQEDMKFITCNTDKSPTTFKNLPAKRKTISLRFQNLKTKVCKPFSA